MQKIGKIYIADPVRSTKCRLTWGTIVLGGRESPVIRVSIDCKMDYGESLSNLSIRHDVYHNEVYISDLTTKLLSFFDHVDRRIKEVGESEGLVVGDGLGLFSLTLNRMSGNGAYVTLSISATQDDTPWMLELDFDLPSREIRRIASELLILDRDLTRNPQHHSKSKPYHH